MQITDFKCTLVPVASGKRGGRISRRRGNLYGYDLLSGDGNRTIEGKRLMSKNIVDVRWFTGKGSVGVVLLKTEFAGYKAYIGVGLDVNEDYDAAFIVAWGTKLPRNIAMAYFPKKIKDGVKYDGKNDTRAKSRKNIDGQKPGSL